jgi:aminoglycoside 3-N-acetyltransferase
MWKRESLICALREMGVREGDSLIVHTSLSAVGQIEGGADAFLDALLEAVGAQGTVLVPAFRLEKDRESDFPAECLLQREGAVCSRHPLLPFAALGANAAFLTANVPFHYPLGTNSPLARLHQLNGGALLIGVRYAAHAALHLAENWADAPYARRKRAVMVDTGIWQEMEGSPECSAGFGKIEPVLRQARIVREGYVGSAPSQYMRLQQVVSMAREMLCGNPEALLCDDPDCASCVLARRFTRRQDL